ncbi:hypothetical protein ABZ642_08280 [Streptomyces sp. NPDC007157]|uniref:hypothetical protein n=1 Tax=Streptomyces sp. NPDC007157 TaxID=3154681 RepID=UPI0033DC59C3
MADAHAEREQAAFESDDQVPGTGLSPGRGQVARGCSCGDEHRARPGEQPAP